MVCNNTCPRCNSRHEATSSFHNSNIEQTHFKFSQQQWSNLYCPSPEVRIFVQRGEVFLTVLRVITIIQLERWKLVSACCDWVNFVFSSSFAQSILYFSIHDHAPSVSVMRHICSIRGNIDIIDLHLRIKQHIIWRQPPRLQKQRLWNQSFG